MVGWGMEGGMASWTSLGRKSIVYQDLSTKSLSKLARVASGMEFSCGRQRCGVRVHTRSVLDPSHAT